MLARVERRVRQLHRTDVVRIPSLAEWYQSLPPERQELVAAFMRIGHYSIERHRGPRAAVELLPTG